MTEREKISIQTNGIKYLRLGAVFRKINKKGNKNYVVCMTY